MTTTISVSGNSYHAYMSVEDIDSRLAPDLGRATAWTGYDDDTKAAAAIMATRYVDRHTWAGEPAVGGQPLAFPRKGQDELPQPLLQAVAILAHLFAGDPSQYDVTSTATTDKRVKAGSAEVERFNPSQVPAATPMPSHVWALLSQYAGGGGVIGCAKASGLDQAENLPNPGYDVNRGSF